MLTRFLQPPLLNTSPSSNYYIPVVLYRLRLHYMFLGSLSFPCSLWGFVFGFFVFLGLGSPAVVNNQFRLSSVNFALSGHFFPIAGFSFQSYPCPFLPSPLLKPTTQQAMESLRKQSSYRCILQPMNSSAQYKPQIIDKVVRALSLSM